MALAHIATLGGFFFASRSLDDETFQGYALVNSFLPIAGLWSDWGRANFVFRSQASRQGKLDGLRSAAQSPTLAIPTLTFACLFFYILPSLSAGSALTALLRETVLLIIAGTLITAGNVLRQPVLAVGNVHTFFYLHLWITAGLPLIFLFGSHIAVGALVCSLGFLLTSYIAWMRLAGPRGRQVTTRQYIRGEQGVWTFGATQLLMGASVIGEVAFIVFLGPQDALAFIALSRLVQATASVCTRPLEAGSAALLAANRQEWRRRCAECFWLTLVSVIGLSAVGAPFAQTWFDLDPVSPWLALAAGTAAGTTVLMRSFIAVLAVAGHHRELMVMALTETFLKFALGLVLVSWIGAGGLLVSSACAALYASALGWRHVKSALN